MRVQYEIFDEDKYFDACAIREDLYPNETFPTAKEYTEVGTGEIVEYIKGGIFSEDMFLIADDKTRKFKKVKVSNCKRIKE